MAGLQRFITYIYKYDNDEKMENTGFAKFEIRGNICKIEAHIRNISMEQNSLFICKKSGNYAGNSGWDNGCFAGMRGR